MLKRLFDFLFKDLSIFSCAYSNNIFPSPLSKEEEDEALELARMGDVIAKNKLIEHNLRLVVFLAKKYENTNVDLEDLVSIGTIGLKKGINNNSCGKKDGTISVNIYMSKSIYVKIEPNNKWPL